MGKSMGTDRCFRLSLVMVAGALWLACIPQVADAQARVASQRELVMGVRTLANRARTQAPIPIELSLLNTKSQVLRGNLELTLWIDNSVEARILLADLALPPGENRRRLMLPEIYLDNPVTQVTLEGWFEMSSQRLDLGDNHDVVVPNQKERHLVILDVSESGNESNRTHLAVRDSLQLQRYDPVADIYSRNAAGRSQGASPGEPQSNQRTLVVNPSLMPPRDFPTSAELLCGIDLVLLSPEGLLGLKEQQLAALTDWVKAGGSLCVRVPVGEPVTPVALKFLNAWASEENEGPRYLTLPGKRELTLPESEAQAPWKRFQRGWGRVVLIEGEPASEEFTLSSEWLKNIGFLWHLHSQRIEELIASQPNPQWKLQTNSEILDLLKVNDVMTNSAEAAERRWSNLLPQIVQQLQPQAVTELPVGRFLAVLVLFFVVVIPGDYYGLGAIRGRRWTWVVVPLCSVLFAWAISGMADAVMGPKGFAHQLVISDLDSGGQQVRRSVLNLRMVSAPQIAEEDLKAQLYVNMTRYQNQRSEQVGLNMGRNRGSRQRSEATSSFRGEMPGAYTVAEPLTRWSPVLTRVTSLGPGELETELNWAEIRNRDWRDLSKLEDLIRAAVPEAEVILLRDGTVVTGETATRSRRFSNPVGPLAVDLTTGRLQVGLPGTNANPRRLLEGVSTQSLTGWFHVVEQISPTGSGTLDDLRVEGFAEVNSGQELLLIIIPGEEQTVVYRWQRVIAP